MICKYLRNIDEESSSENHVSYRSMNYITGIFRMK